MVTKKHWFWYQKASKMEPKSMPELITNQCQNWYRKKIREIINNYVFLQGKIIELHWKKKCFWCLRRLHVRTVKVSQKHQKWNQNPSTNRWTIDTNFIFGKVMQQLQKIIQNWAQKGTPKLSKTYQKSIRTKRLENGGPAHSNPGDPPLQ